MATEKGDQQTPEAGTGESTGPKVRTVRAVRTKSGLKEYTYLGCPLTHNRSPWCFRMCMPDDEGHGRCGRIAPHSFKGRIQLGIERYNQQQREVHRRKLEAMYLAAPCNQYYEPGIQISHGEAEVVIAIQDEFLGAAGSVHESVCHRAMNDAALLAVSSVVPKTLTLTTSFDIRLRSPVTADELIARARFMGMCEDQYLAEAVLLNREGQEYGRGTGTFVKSELPLSTEMGYA